MPRDARSESATRTGAADSRDTALGAIASSLRCNGIPTFPVVEDGAQQTESRENPRPSYSCQCQMTHFGPEKMTGRRVRSDHVSRNVGAAAEALLDARGDARRLKRIFESSPVPMVMVDGRRRYVEVNRAARLWFRLGLEEMRRFALGDLTPAPRDGRMELAWARLLDVGSVAGRYPVDGSDGSRLDVVYCGLAQVLPGLHLIAFAPADWSEDELGVIDDNGGVTSASLTPREIEVLALAADGLSGPDLAEVLVLSPATVNTHFKNIYAKLDVRNRSAAVAKAMRLGVIA
ncbi:MAG: hypothetical protein QOG59_2075 [Solirubrobacteraceae bacterium]|nr:hypothetical protein [Solirubrobacteraceae bacterium]